MAPSPIARRRFVVLTVVASVALVAVLAWPRNDATPVRTRTRLGGSSQGAQRYASPQSYLAWVPGGFDDPNFRARVEGMPVFGEVVVLAGDTLWLGRTERPGGRVVHDPPEPYAFPIDAFAVQPQDYAPFVGGSVRSEIVQALRNGRAVLGEHSARLRRLGPGGRLIFRTGSVRVGAVVPDDAVGWSEMLVNREVGHRLGIAHERYLLAQPPEPLTRRAMKRVLDPLVGDNPIRVDLPGGTRYVRVASGVRPPIVLKEYFGEFAATPQSNPAWLTIQPAWVDRNIVTIRVPLLGTITCHRKLIPMVRAALYEIVEQGLGPEIKVYSGCWASRTVARSPTAPPSYHAYGAAIDINAPQNPYGTEPTMDRRIVRIFEANGFNWGGDFLIPDGHHFEFWRPPEELG